MSEIEDRRQRAREAGMDSLYGPPGHEAPIDVAIEVATQVKITDEVIETFKRLFPTSAAAPRIKRGLDAALTELGFEVIE